MNTKKTYTPEQYFKMACRASDKNDKITALKYYLEAANAGIVPAMMACGSLYFEELGGIEQDIEKAIYWFKKAADCGHAGAMNNVGYVFWTLKDYEEAIKWYKKSAEYNDATAMLNLADVYRNVYYDKKTAQYWLKKAESLKDSESIRLVAGYYAVENSIKDNLNKAIKLYQKAMSMDNLEAFNELGDLYMELDEFDSAQNCYFDGAKLGNVDCMANFGMMMTYAPECFEPAHYWLSKAIKHGNIIAMTLMGDLYREYKNYPKALRWYRKAVSAGDSNASENLQLVKKLLKRHKPNYKLRLRESN